MKRSDKLNKIHSLLILLFSIICITGAVFLCYDKCVVAYICWCVCIMLFPCLVVLNFEYRSSLFEEFFNEKFFNEKGKYKKDMKKIYCIEEWCKFEDGPKGVFRDVPLWDCHETPWKIGCDDIIHEFNSEKEFTEKLLNIINSGGIIGKVYIKEMPDDYNTSLKIG